MKMISPELLSLAKQGNPKAISQLLDRALASKRITTKITRDQYVLTIFAEAPELPNQSSLVGVVQRGIKDLRLDNFHSLKIYGRKVGDTTAGWSEKVLLSALPDAGAANSKGQAFKFSFKPILNHLQSGLIFLFNATRQIRVGKRAITGLFGFVILALLTCGGVIGFNLYQTRSAQMQTIQQVRSIFAQADPNKASGVEALQNARKQLEQARDSLRGIPNSPGSLHTEAQAELAKVRSQLETIEQRISVEETTSRDWEAAVQLGQDAIALVRQPPLPLKDWKVAKTNLDKAITQLSAIPSGTFASNPVKEKLAEYRKQSLVVTQKLAAEEKAMNALQMAERLAKQAMAMTSSKYSLELTDLQNAHVMWQKAIGQLKNVSSQSFAYRDIDRHMTIYSGNSQKISQAIKELNDCKKDSTLSFSCSSMSLSLDEPIDSTDVNKDDGSGNSFSTF
jgi:hypothetical protein